MRGFRRSVAVAAVAAALPWFWSGDCHAQAGDDALAGKTISIVIGYGPGGGFDTYARVLADHLGRHVPGVRTVVAQNMPGAGSMKAANYVFNVGAQDGTVLGIFNENISLNQVLEPRGMKFDVRKFQWIGRLGTRPTLGIVWRSSGVTTLQDVTKKEVVLGGTSGSDYGSQVVRALNDFTGTRFRVVHGYKGTAEIYLAMQRHEVMGLSFAAAEEVTLGHPDWLRDKLISVLQINGVARLPAFPDVPTIVELARTPEQRQIMTFLASKIEIGRSFTAGPGVPKATIATLRKAFDATVRDPKLIADAKKRNVDVSPMSGQDLEKLIAEVLAIKPDLVEKMKKILNPA